MTLRTYDVPDWITESLVGRDLTGADYKYLFGFGRALGFARTAADAIDALGNELKTVEYHAYAGVSASRTAIDAAAHWVRVRLPIHVTKVTQVDFKNKRFRGEIVKAKPQTEPYVLE